MNQPVIITLQIMRSKITSNTLILRKKRKIYEDVFEKFEQKLLNNLKKAFCTIKVNNKKGN